MIIDKTIKNYTSDCKPLRKGWMAHIQSSFKRKNQKQDFNNMKSFICLLKNEKKNYSSG